MEQEKTDHILTYPPVVCLGFTPWKGNYAKSTTQLINRLARKHKIMYVDYQFTFKDVLLSLLGKSDLDIMPILGFKQRLRIETTPQGTHVYVLSLPPVMPINWINSDRLFRLGLRINSFLIRQRIRKAIKSLEMEKPVFMSAYNPFIGLYSVGKFKERMHCYYCYDEISGSPWAQKYGAAIEEDYIKKVDLVMTSSRPLLESKSKFNSNCELVQNGVDFDFFNAYYLAHGAQNHDSNIIGYVGSLDERIDYTLIRAIADKYPDYEIRLIGRVVFPELLEEIRDAKNINLTGPMSYEELPAEVAKFKVGLIPFLKTKFTRYIYPLKINEYLSMNVPVVKTNFSDLDEFEGLVYTGIDHSDYLVKVDQALQEEVGYMKAERIRMAASNSWDASVDKLSALISV